MEDDLNDLYGDITVKPNVNLTNEDDSEYLQTLAAAKSNAQQKATNSAISMVSSDVQYILSPHFPNELLTADASGRPKSMSGYLLQGPPPIFQKKSNLFVHISNLVFWATDRTIENLFSFYGRVRLVIFLEDKTSGKSIGEALLQFEEDESAYIAVEKLHGVVLEGQPISVCIATPEQQNAFVTHNKGKKERQQHQLNMPVQGQQNARRNGQGGGRGSRSGGRNRSRNNNTITTTPHVVDTISEHQTHEYNNGHSEHLGIYESSSSRDAHMGPDIDRNRDRINKEGRDERSSRDRGGRDHIEHDRNGRDRRRDDRGRGEVEHKRDRQRERETERERKRERERSERGRNGRDRERRDRDRHEDSIKKRTRDNEKDEGASRSVRSKDQD